MIPSPDEVKAALEHSDSFWDDYFDEKQDHMGALLAAARAFVSLIGEGEKVKWCEEHLESAWSPDECWKQVYGEDDHYVPHDSPCRIVTVSLIPENLEGERT